MLRRTPQAAVTTQYKQQLPLRVRTRLNDFVRRVAGHEELTSLIGLATSLHVGEGVLGDQLPFHCPLEHLPRHADTAGDGRLCDSLSLIVAGICSFQPLPPLVPVRWLNVSQRFVLTEELLQAASRLRVCRRRSGLDAQAGEVIVEKGF